MFSDQIKYIVIVLQAGDWFEISEVSEDDDDDPNNCWGIASTSQTL